MKHYLLMIVVVGCGKKEEKAIEEVDKLIADPIVEKAIRKSLKKPTGELTKTDLKSGKKENDYIRLLKASAEKGDAEDQSLLGEAYSYGEFGVGKNYVTAYAWFNIAAANVNAGAGEHKGNTFSKLFKISLAKRMTPDQIAKAEALAKEMIKKNPKMLSKEVGATEELPEPGKIDDYTVIGFDRLSSFIYEVPDGPITEPKAKAILDKNEIPKRVTKYNKQKVAIKGYMIRVSTQAGKITELLIQRDPPDNNVHTAGSTMSPFPRINEWVSVRMPEGKGVKDRYGRRMTEDVPVTIFGTLRVGEVLVNGYLVSIYEMDGERHAWPD